jgi:hypothetical protein
MKFLKKALILLITLLLLILYPLTAESSHQVVTENESVAFVDVSAPRRGDTS